LGSLGRFGCPLLIRAACGRSIRIIVGLLLGKLNRLHLALPLTLLRTIG
jgi:hypothetical protein